MINPGGMRADWHTIAVGKGKQQADAAHAFGPVMLSMMEGTQMIEPMFRRAGIK